MHGNPKYSVIIPVYNAEATLCRCVNSLLDQKYPDMELILVNDGSRDSSGTICQEYRDKSDQVVYIEKPNGGASSARNAGLDAARGHYVLFVDSDDYVSEDYFSVLDEQYKEYNYDCVFYSHATVKNGSVNPNHLTAFSSVRADESTEQLCTALYKKYLTPPWNKCFLRSIIEQYHIRFPVHLYVGEDKSFSLEYAMHCRSCKISSEIMYYVCLDNEMSLSRKPRPDLEQQLEMLTKQTWKTIHSADIAEKYRQQYIAAENLIQLRAVYSETKRMHLSGQSRKLRREKIRSMCRSNNAEKAPLPGGMFSRLLQIPVRLKMITVIDLMGWYLAR